MLLLVRRCHELLLLLTALVNVVVSPALPNRLLVVKKLFLRRLFFLGLSRVDRLLLLVVWLLDNSVVDELLFMHVDIEVHVDVQVYLILLLRCWVPAILLSTWLICFDVSFGVLLMMLNLTSFIFSHVLLLYLDDLLVLDC